MVEEASRSTIPEKFREFEPTSMDTGDRISYFQNGAWHTGVLDESPKLRGDIVSVSVDGGNAAESRIPPKKLQVPTVDSLVIGNIEYTFDPNNITDNNLDEDGNLIYDLQSQDPNPADRRLVQEVPANLIVAIEKGLNTAAQIEAAVTRISKISDFKKKELLKTQDELKLKAREILVVIGSGKEWGEMEKTEAENIIRRVKDLNKEILGEEGEGGKLEILQEQIKSLNKAIKAKKGAEKAAGLQANLVTEVAKKQTESQSSFDSAKEIWDAWKKYDNDKRTYDHKKTIWEDAQAAAAPAGGGGGGNRPAAEDPGPEPVEPTEPRPADKPKKVDEKSIEVEIKMSFFDSLPDSNQLKKQIIRQRKANSKSAGSGADFPAGDPNGSDEEKEQNERFLEETSKAVDTVLVKNQKLSSSEVEVKFVFTEEIKDLKRKIAYTKRTLPDGLAPLKKDFELLWDEVSALKEDDSDIRKKILDIWERFYKKKVEAFGTKEEKAKPTRELKKRDIDIPQNLVRDIIVGRQAEVERVMRTIYTDSILQRNEEGEISGKDVSAETKIKDALRALFDQAPDLAMQNSLRDHGVRDWDHFKLLLEGKLGDKLSLSLNEMAQTQLKAEMSKRIGPWKRAKAMWGQIAGRGVTTAALVGASALGVNYLSEKAEFLRPVLKIAEGSISDTGAATAGAAGGFIRGYTNKLWDRLGKNRVQKLQGGLEQSEKDQFINEMIETDFRDVNNFDNESSVMFSAVLSQTLREATVEGVQTEDDNEIAELQSLDANAKRIYREAVRRLEFEGENVKLEQKRELILLLLDLQTSTDMHVADKIKDADPKIAQVVTGAFNLFTGRSEKWGKLKSTITGSLLGVAMLGNPVSSSIITGLAGLGAGVKFGEKKRLEREEELGLQEVNSDLGVFEPIFNRFRAGNPVTNVQTDLLRDVVIKFKSALKGGGDEDIVSSNYVAVLRNNPMLKKRVENYVYEAENLELLVERNASRDLGRLLTELDALKTNVERGTDKKLMQQVKKLLKKAGWTTGSALAGVGAGVAVGLSAGFLARKIMSGFSGLLGVDSPPVSSSEIESATADTNVEEVSASTTETATASAGATAGNAEAAPGEVSTGGEIQPDDSSSSVASNDSVEDSSVEPTTKTEVAEAVAESGEEISKPETAQSEEVKTDQTAPKLRKSFGGGGGGVRGESLVEPKEVATAEPEPKNLDVKTETQPKPAIEAGPTEELKPAEVASTPEETGYGAREIKHDGYSAFLGEDEGVKNYLQTMVLDTDEKFSVIFDEDGTKIGFVDGGGVAHEGDPQGGWPKGVPETMSVPGEPTVEELAPSGEEVEVAVDSGSNIDEIMNNQENRDLFIWLNSAANGQVSDIDPGEQLAAANLKNQFDLAHNQGNVEEVNRVLEEMKTLKNRVELEPEAVVPVEGAADKTEFNLPSRTVVKFDQGADGEMRAVYQTSRHESDGSLVRNYLKEDKIPTEMLGGERGRFLGNLRNVDNLSFIKQGLVDQGVSSNDPKIMALDKQINANLRFMSGYSDKTPTEFLDPDVASKLGH